MNKKSILKVIAAVGLKSAKIGNNSASVFGFHQPKEPAMLKYVSHKFYGSSIQSARASHTATENSKVYTQSTAY